MQRSKAWPLPCETWSSNAMGVKVFLCGFHRVGDLVLNHLLQRPDVGEVAVFTHEAPPHVTNLQTQARKYGVWCTTDSVNKASGPFAPDIIASVYYRYIIR